MISIIIFHANTLYNKCPQILLKYYYTILYNFIQFYTSTMLKLLSPLLALLCLLVATYQWNPTVKCSSLQSLLNNPRLAVWQALMLDNPTLMPTYSALSSASNNLISKHSRPIGSPPEWVCANFYRYNESCCSVQDLENYTETVMGGYEQATFEGVHYPIFEQLFNTVKLIEASKCYEKETTTNKTTPTPTNTTTKTTTNINTTTNTSRIIYPQTIQQHIATQKRLLGTMIDMERQFIRETLCMMCMGVRDMPTFLYPDSTATSNLSQLHFNHLIIDSAYFHNRTAALAQLYLQLEQMHDPIRHYILNITASCQSIEYVERKRICESEASCLKVAVKYWGEAGAPQNVLYIRQRAHDSGIGMAGNDYYLSNTTGFRGNVTTYKGMYGTHYLPPVQVYAYPQYIGLW